jgi:predicted ester cyclase
MGRVLMEKFKEIYERWMDIWNGDVDLIGEVVSPVFVGHWPPAAVDAPFDVIGPARLREMVGMSRNLFPDLRVEVQVGPVTEGDTMAARWVGRGHYAGGIRGATAPPGTEVRFFGSDFLRIESDRIVEYWVSSDGLSLMAQVGALPGSGPE